MNWKTPFLKLSFNLLVVGVILCLIGLSIVIGVNDNIFSQFQKLLNLSWSKEGIIAFVFILELIIFLPGFILFFLWLNNDSNYYFKLIPVGMIFASTLLTLILLIIVTSFSSFLPNILIAFIGYVLLLIGLIQQSVEWYLYFLENKEHISQSKNNQFYEFNREVIVNQEEQKLNEIEHLKNRLHTLKDELGQVGKINNSKTIENDDTQLLTKTYNNSDYYINQVDELDNAIETNNNEKSDQDITSNLFSENDDDFEQNNLNFKIPYNIEEIDVADEDLILPSSYRSINSQDI